jgi:hypothetical protein
MQLSVILCTRNRQQMLIGCLGSIAKPLSLAGRSFPKSASRTGIAFITPRSVC